MISQLLGVVVLILVQLDFCSSFTQSPSISAPKFHNGYNVFPDSQPHLRKVHPNFHSYAATKTSRSLGIIPTVQAAFQTSGVQKVLELGVIAGIGSALRNKLDGKAVTALLLNAMVPAVIVSSLSSLTLTSEMGTVLLSGILLATTQLGAGELASRFVIPRDEPVLRRTAGVQLGTMAPALSVYSFTREFVGSTYAGLQALADIPTKIYTLLLVPYYLRFRGSGQKSQKASTDNEKSESVSQKSTFRKIINALGDPFNLAITCGLLLATFGTPISSLGFFGKAIGSLASAQTAVLFLLIGIKLQIKGDRPRLCLRLLFARHGFCSLAVSSYLATFMSQLGPDARLAVVLSSQAACSIIAYGQMAKVATVVDGYDTDLAFDIVALSFPLTAVLNTIACLVGSLYVDYLPLTGTLLLVLSALAK